MLDVGFEEDVRVILGKTCSVHRLAEEYMDPNPIKVVIGSEDLAANHDVMQIVEAEADRIENMLQRRKKGKTQLGFTSSLPGVTSMLCWF
ncbi:DEAD-box ATP-dependent RNA helicase 5-like isoform X3 [Durio zibethinus]|uniref:DEAD-box ATP-dependent RNA helicase 5-like isoform X3 n=1 Tax=Durio zibethinus TaxID=66656 RepID=A0A6P5Y703_DURZI|nr:DEAD-box ATP-dependent RNA helicase 5-like isoform X3 [Durio zibethinus]XP_022736206.1 DEAD-box ATP-dependent RNA helicase 5-like isoform X3 [Durio zibethinus]